MVTEINEKRTLVGLFLRDKPAKILIGLRTNAEPVYATILSKEANCTYSHTIKILNVLKDLGIVEFKKKGRIKRIVLTEAGTDIAQHMEKMIGKFLKLESGTTKVDGKTRKNKK